MGRRRYGISLRVFNSIELRSLVSYRVEHEKRNSISTCNHVLLCLSYKHNSPLLTRIVDSSNKLKIKRIDNPRIQIVKCVGALMMKITIKTNNRPNFHYTKFSVIELVLTDRRNHSGKRPK